MFTITEIIDIAMKIEKNGETIYRNAIEKIPVPSLVPLLEWIANEEANHAEWFSNLKQKTETN
ncbi:MAG: rubrerythrin, partial [Desulfobacterales bacterium]